MTRTATLAAAALGLALSAAVPAPARANDIGGAILEGVLGMALGHMGGGSAVQPQRYRDGGYAYGARPAYGYGRRDRVSDQVAVYRQLSARYGSYAVDDCLDDPSCVRQLRRAWKSEDQRRLDRVFANR